MSSKPRTTDQTGPVGFGYGDSDEWPERVEHGTLGLPDLNTAPKRRIAALPGVGPERAERIIEYRERHGAFNLLDDLLMLEGFDASVVEGLRGRVLVGGRLAA